MDYSHIKAFVFDIDGVMTDGGILALPDGDLLRTYDAKDSFAVRMAVMNGYRVGIITGGSSASITRRFLSCGVPEEAVFLHSRNKMEDLVRFCSLYGLIPDEVMYFGDDVPDIPVLSACGISVCPSDACKDVKSVCDIISEFPGGHGCIRHAFEDVMRSQGRWNFDCSLYKSKF